MARVAFQIFLQRQVKLQFPFGLQVSKEKQIIKPLKTLVKRLNLKILLAPPTMGSVCQLFS